MGQNVIFSVGLSANLLMAANAVCNGTMTPGDFVMIQALFMQLAGPLFNMGTFIREVDQSSVDVEDLFHMLKQNPVVKNGNQEFEYKKGEIIFRNLGFKHYIFTQEESKDVMKEKLLFENFDLKIEPGTTNAIVGQSGFGKTTLLNLLYRIYDPTEGEIMIDGQNIKDLKFDSFRKHISIIP